MRAGRPLGEALTLWDKLRVIEGLYLSGEVEESVCEGVWFPAQRTWGDLTEWVSYWRREVVRWRTECAPSRDSQSIRRGER